MLSALKKNGVKDINSHYGKGGRFLVKAKKSWLALPVFSDEIHEYRKR